MPVIALAPRIIQGVAEMGVLVARNPVPKHEIVEAFLVSKFARSSASFDGTSLQWTVFVSVFGVGGAIVYAVNHC